jgi:hypothetical protein
MLGALTAIGTGVGALGGILGAGEQRRAEKRAGRQLRKTLGEQRGLFGEQQELYEPYYETGMRALPAYEYAATGIYPEDYEAPDVMRPEQRAIYEQMAESVTRPVTETSEYQRRIEESEDAINKALAARGLYGSSYGVGALEDARADILSEMESERYGRLGGLYGTLRQADVDRYNRLASLAGLGGTAAGQLSSNIGQFSGLLGGTGQQLAASQRQLGNIGAQMYSGLGSMPLAGLGTYSQLLEAQRPQFGIPSGGAQTTSPGFPSTYNLFG